MHAALSTALLILLSALPLSAQAGTLQPLKPEEVVALNQAGLPAADLVAILEKSGCTVKDSAGLEALRSAGVAAPVLAWIEARIPKPAKPALTPTEVKGLLKSGLSEAEVLALITKSGARFDLTTEDMIGLIRDGVPPAIIKAMRENGATNATVAAAAKPVTLDDILSMTAGGIGAEEILRRVRTADARFDIDVEGLLRLTRNSVPQEVVREIWSRRTTPLPQPTQTPQTSPASAQGATPAATPVTPLPETAGDLMLHREAEGGYSLMVPRGWYIHRERSGSNGLVSFTISESPAACGLADAEIQVFRSRAANPERLTETNLEPIASNFLNRLQASFAGRKVSFSFGTGNPTRLSGRAGMVYKVASAAADGTTHEGEVTVMLHDDQVFVISWAVRAEQLAAESARMAACAQSFDVSRDASVEPLRGKDEDQIASVFSMWRTALLNSDWSLALKVLPDGADTVAAREQFAQLTRRCVQPGANLALGGIRCEGDKATAQCTLNGAEPMPVAFARDAKGWRIQP